MWISDYVVYSMIDSTRGSAIAKRKAVDAAMCGWYAFWCTNPTPPFRDSYLTALKDYDLNRNLRLELHDHAIDLLASIQNNQKVSVLDVVVAGTTELKSKRTYILQERGELRNAVSSELCYVDAGDVIRLEAADQNPEQIVVQIEKTIDPDDTSCKEGNTLLMDISAVQDLENDFAQRVEEATGQAETLLARIPH